MKRSHQRKIVYLKIKSVNMFKCDLQSLLQILPNRGIYYMDFVHISRFKLLALFRMNFQIKRGCRGCFVKSPDHYGWQVIQY